MKTDHTASRITALLRSSAFIVGALGLTAMPVSAAHVTRAAHLTRTIQVNGAASAVWSLIGPFCAIKDWLPPVGTCIEDGKSPPTRTLVTKDGKATFVEIQTGRSEAGRSYSYAFVSSPLPVTHYKSTITVTPNGPGASTVTWTGTYTPAAGKERDAMDALSGIYEAGLAGIAAKFKK